MKFGKLDGNDYNNLIMNDAINAFRIAVGDNISFQNMVDMFVDEYEDETGIDNINSVNILYDATDDYYSMGEGDTTAIDYMEYSSDGNAQSAYVATDAVNFQSYSEDIIVNEGTYSLKMVATQTDSLTDKLVKAFSPSIDLSNKDTIKLQTRATRTGTNFKLSWYAEYNTKLLLHLNGTDGATSTSDASESNHSIAFNGSAQLDTAQQALGVSSVLLNGSTDYLYLNDSADWDFNTDDFTIEMRVRFNSISGLQCLYDTDTSSGGLRVIKMTDNTIQVSIAGTALYFAFTPAVDTWYQVMVIRTGNILRLFINGTQGGSDADVTGKDVTGSSSGLYLGSSVGGSWRVNGWMDEVRVVKGKAVETSNFTTSSVEYLTPLIKSSNIIINSANTWEEKTIDISALTNAEKNNITELVIEIINADSANTLYLDDIYAFANPTGYTLISENQVAESEPDEARIIVLMEEVNSITLNTDLKAWVSRDDGSTWSQATLIDKGDYDNNIKILYGEIDLAVSGIGSGTNLVYKLTTHNSKNCKIHATSVAWR